MQIDNKYFIPFILIMAIVAALLITFFTVSSQESQRRAFERRIMAQDSMKYEMMPILGRSDSVSAGSFTGKYVILDFWATWSNYSLNVHRQLAKLVNQHRDSLVVIAAVVQDKPGKVSEYIEINDFPFTFTEGTRVFNSYHVPGMPVELLYSPKGDLLKIFFGSGDTTKFDTLGTLLRDAQP